MLNDPCDEWRGSDDGTAGILSLSSVLRTHGFFVACQIGASILALVWWQHTPAPGFAVAVIAVVAAVLSIHTDARGWQKFIWMLLMGAFLLIEFRAIRTDRKDNEAAQSNLREEERKSFRSVLDQDNAHFLAMLQPINSSLNATKRVMTKAEEAANFSSGGNSFPTVFPYIVTQSSGEKQIGFTAEKRGNYPLYGLVITLGRPYRTSPTSMRYANGASFKSEEFQNGFSIPMAFLPLPTEEVAYYSASMLARNGQWEEVIEYRRIGTKTVFRWALYGADPANVTPNKEIFDLASADFPTAYRNLVIFPLLSVSTIPLDTAFTAK